MNKTHPLNNASPAAPPLEYDFPCANPASVINRLRDLRRLRNDAELSRVLGLTPPTVSKIRSGKARISAAIILRIHEVYGMPVADLRSMLAHC